MGRRLLPAEPSGDAAELRLAAWTAKAVRKGARGGDGVGGMAVLNKGERGSGDRRCGGDRARQIFFWLMGAKAEGVEGIREASTQRAADAWLQRM